ncbi:MAG: hypothetical protein LBD58_00330 [Treponema sp.]|nr:hypothetical protein [Treponema sp.]
MKKFWLICLVGLLAIGMGLAGCAGSPAPTTDAPSEAVAAEETVDEAEVADEAAEEEVVEAEEAAE